MILSGLEIKKRLGKDIIIDPFDERNVNPNSYDLRLHNKLLVYEDNTLDMRRPSPTREIEIPPEGLLIRPGILYLGRTHEYTRTEKYVPMLEGRSSVGRLGMYVHITAGFGDVGFAGYWTLEITCVHPIRIYPMARICQIYFYSIKGRYIPYSSPKYQDNKDIQPSLMHQDYEQAKTCTKARDAAHPRRKKK